MSPLRIAIVGGGPAGCTLARLLQQSDNSIEVVIFEGEASFNSRSQGGTLDLHTETGLAAIRKAGLYDEFLKYARFDAESFRVTDKNLRRYINMGGTKEGSSRGRPEIDRSSLREILMNSIDPKCVRWGKKLRKVEQAKDGRWTLKFDDGDETGFDLVVGADGAWSKVRAVLSDAKPYFTGVGGINFSIKDVKSRYPAFDELVNRGSLFCFSDNRSFMAQQMGDGSLNLHTWEVKSEDWQKGSGIDYTDASQVKRVLLKEFSGWQSVLSEMIEAMDEETCTPRSLYMLPVGLRWEHQPGITVIGDAAHLTSPFAGEGVNLAMKDALDLAEAIIKTANQDEQSLSSSVRQYEEAMFKRSASVTKQTEDMMNYMYFTPGAPDTSIEKWILRAAGDGVPTIVYPLLQAGVYSYFALWRWLGWGKHATPLATKTQ